MKKNSHNVYSNPLTTRYASKEMNKIFSPEMKYTTWRKLWLELARAQKELGLPITQEQIDELESHIFDLNLDVAAEYEKRFRHDVMAHIHAYGDQCPNARPIIHLGATSAFVGDNTDLIQIREALFIIKTKLVNIIRNLKDFALKYKHLPTLGFTHFQPAQLTTVGKRAALWLQDFVIDYNELYHLLSTVRFRGVKGTTGTQASFLSLFDDDHEKVKRLDDMLCKSFGFNSTFLVTGQTYTRKLDAFVASFLSGVCQSISKMANDIRLLSHLKEVEEPFETSQVGSSAMPYKRNPMRCERMNSIARFVMSLESSPAFTAATQWFERTLDDSANKRLSIPQMFLGTDSVLRIAINVTSGLIVYPEVIRKHINNELPFIASENILMKAVKKGGDRQALHEEIRTISHEVSKRIKSEGAENDFIEWIKKSDLFDLDEEELAVFMDPSLYIGRVPEQLEEFIESEVDPILKKETDIPVEGAELNV
ncbi:adenylosuccinate lyase [Candidatus Latescibacterota bacterium]